MLFVIDVYNQNQVASLHSWLDPFEVMKSPMRFLIGKVNVMMPRAQTVIFKIRTFVLFGSLCVAPVIPLPHLRTLEVASIAHCHDPSDCHYPTQRTQDPWAI